MAHQARAWGIKSQGGTKKKIGGTKIRKERKEKKRKGEKKEKEREKRRKKRKKKKGGSKKSHRKSCYRPELTI